MKLEEIIELYDLISSGVENIHSRKQAMSRRKEAFESAPNAGFNKVSFDTRRINQETQYVPRRGLQNYHRSEGFLSEAMVGKLRAFSKLNKLLDGLKAVYGREPEWQDSYTRVLSSAVSKVLRTDQLDGDYSDSQPSMASVDYLEELLYMRYRLTPENLQTMSEGNLKKVLLSRDDSLNGLSEMLGKHMPAVSPIANRPKAEEKLQTISGDMQNVFQNENFDEPEKTSFGYEKLMEKIMMNVMSQTMQNLTNQFSPQPVVKTAPTQEEKTVTITLKV